MSDTHQYLKELRYNKYIKNHFIDYELCKDVIG